MFDRIRRNWFLTAALALMIVISGGCGGDDDDDGDDNGTGGEADIRDGNWGFTITTSGLGPGEECTFVGEPTPFPVPFQLCSLDDPGDLGGDDLGECEQEVAGDEVIFDCHSTETFGDCSITTHTEGSGTFAETTFDLTFVVYEVASPASAECLAQAEPCTTSYRIQGTWLNGDADCTEDASNVVPLARVWKNASKIAGLR